MILQFFFKNMRLFLDFLISDSILLQICAAGEMADTKDLGSFAVRCVGSSPAPRTILSFFPMIDSNISAVNQIKSVKFTGFWYQKKSSANRRTYKKNLAVADPLARRSLW